MNKTFIIICLFMITGCGVDPENDDVTVNAYSSIIIFPQFLHTILMLPSTSNSFS